MITGEGKSSQNLQKVIPLQESDLPLLLPEVENYAPTGTEE